MNTTKITVQSLVHAPIQTVWRTWTEPEHIMKWNFASDDWHCPRVSNDLRVGGTYSARMEARDGSFGFDFITVYDEIIPYQKITYTMEDGRQATTTFIEKEYDTEVTTTFDAENINSPEMQQGGWQAILDNFKKYTENMSMNKLQFKINIQAPVSKVWNAMLGLEDKSTYEFWAREFNPTSTFEGNWEKGTKILFIGVDENGEKGGVVSEIRENIPNKFISIRAYGLLKGDIEMTTGEEVEKWAGGHENYTFEENNGITTVTVDMDTIEDFADYFNETYPKALNKLKSMLES